MSATASDAKGLLQKINSSASLLAIVFGLLFIGISAGINFFRPDGVVPALLTIWGGGAILIGVVAYASIWWLKQ